MSAPVSRRSLVAAVALTPALAAATQVGAAPFGREAWDKKVAAWTILSAMRMANRDFGPQAKATYAHFVKERELSQRYGSREQAMLDPVGEREFRKSFDWSNGVDDQAWEDFGWPAELAAKEVALEPAPDLEALLLKIRVITEHELNNFTDMPRDPWEIVMEDYTRLRRNT